MRKLASIRKISAINPIPNADAIEVATVDGWKVVVKKGEYKVGDLCVYLEIDSWVPYALAPFLTQKGQEPKTYEGIVGNRLRTVKLRGQVSQGLLLPLVPTCDMIESQLLEGLDVTAPLGILKWEAPIPAQLSGQVKGSFPSFIPKTDQERAQNIVTEIFEQHGNSNFEVSLKLDGTSCTVYFNRGFTGICSRNLELKYSDENKDNSFIRVANDSGLALCLSTIGKNVAVQGELMGPGIQGNREGLKETKLFIFDIYDIDEGRYMGHNERMVFVNRMLTIGMNPHRCDHVPVIAIHAPCEFSDLEGMLNFADGPSLKHEVREGLVWKSIWNPEFSFKTISNQFLLSEK